MPRRRLAEPARYGIGAKPSQLKRHPEARKPATLLATVRYLEAKTVDDGLELLDLLMVTELLGKAQRAAGKGTVRRAPKLAKASARLVVAVEVLLEATGWGEEIRPAEVWDAIDMVIPRAELRAAVATVTGIVPPPDAEDDGGWRAEIAGRIATVSGFVKLLPTLIAFGANAEGIEVLRAMRCLAAQLDSSRKWTTKTTHAQVVTGPWKRLVFGHPADPGGAVDKNAYTFCVLEQFHRHLKRREIYAETSLRWRDLNAHLLEGAEWAAVKTPVLTAPGPARGPRRAAGHSLGWPGCGLSRGRPEVLPVQALPIEEGEQVLQVVPVRAQSVRRELPVPKVIQEPADRPHRLSLIVDRPNPADDPAIPLPDDPHLGLLALRQQGCGPTYATKTRQRGETPRSSQANVQIRTCMESTRSRCRSCRAGAGSCATRTPQATRTTTKRGRRSASAHQLPRGPPTRSPTTTTSSIEHLPAWWFTTVAPGRIRPTGR